MRYETHWIPARVRATRDLTRSVRLFEIEPEGVVARYAPGSHLNFSLLIGGQPATRSYSLVGEAPTDGAYRVAVKMPERSRGGAAAMWSLVPGARLTISNPQNLFELTRGRSAYLLIAGGIGITPLIGMADALARHGDSFRLLFAGRTRDDLPFSEEMRGAHGDRVEMFVTAEGSRLDLAGEIDALPADGELYLCGPMRLLDAARAIWRARGRPMSHFRFETFGSSGRFAPEPFRVQVPRLGVDIVVSPEQTMLDALRTAGVDVLYDCQRGECGLCAMSILSLSGTADHRDVFFNEMEKTENHQICACVSRVVGGGIVVDSADRDR